jgi:phosphatidylinositol alpha-1,6-mannosyltransferase
LGKNIGGMQRVSLQLNRELDKKQLVTVDREVINVSADFNRLQTIAFLVKNMILLPRKVQQADADIVIFSSMVTAIMAPFIQNRLSVPMVAICHGRDVMLPNSIYQRAVSKAFRHLDGIIAISRATKNECVRRGVDPDKTVIIPNGISPADFGDMSSKEEARSKLSKRFDISVANKRILLTVGRMVKRKGHEWFIREVMPKLQENTIYIIIGDGPEYKPIHKLADDNLLSDRLFLLGQQPDEVLKQAYAAADLFVMPNIPVEGDMEGFGVVLLEANMGGTPAIAADIEGIKDVLVQGKNGYRIPALDAEQFAQKVQAISENQLEHFSKQTRSYILKQFSWHRIIQRYCSYFQSITQRFRVKHHSF